MKILNCVLDEKFTQGGISVLEMVEAIDRVDNVIVGKPQPLKYSCTSEIKFIAPEDFIKHLTTHNYSAVVINGLAALPYQLIEEIPSSIKVLWNSWGYDLYTMPCEELAFLRMPLYWPKTSALINTWKHRLHKLYLKYRLKPVAEALQRSVSRIDYISCVIPQEEEMMCKLPFVKAKPYMFSYGYEYLSYEVKEKMGSGILVANSGNPINNHLDTFELLRKAGVKDRLVFAPLSYGGSEQYRQTVITKGKELFGKHFLPMTDFMPRDQYFKTLEACGNAIFLSERQSAVGNIYIALRQGMKVFVSETSLLYPFLISIGCVIRSAQRDLTAEELETPLTKEERRHNLKLVYDPFTKEAIYKRINESFEPIIKDIKESSNEQHKQI